jgi:multicomponent Na+:H+ antiporter subunit B
MRRVIEVLVVLSVSLFLVLSLSGPHSGESPIRDHVVNKGPVETGALNLVTAIYLGYRAYDTVGETIVLLLAVSGVTVLVGRKS